MNPRILILDDATSNVDARVEAAIRKGLRSAMTGRTTIIVARRPQTAALADRVAFMERGKHRRHRHARRDVGAQPRRTARRCWRRSTSTRWHRSRSSRGSGGDDR